MSTLQGSLSATAPAEKKVTASKYGTFFGVFLPSALSIFGVIMYLRLGTILGHIGLIPTLSIISIASLITFITALSISTVATNMKIKKGGAYYIISRSLGIDFGTAIGIPIYLAQAFGIAFYILGFSETLHAFYPAFDEMHIRMGTLLILGLLGFFSTNIVLKTQFLIFLAIVASLVSIVLGDPIVSVDAVATMGPKLGYWAAFAIFFPAVTGIEAGVSMSGVLKNPRKSLPIGSIVSVLVGLVVYSLLAWLLWERAPREVLATDNMVCAHLAKYSSLIILGIWGATLSSALGGLLGAPRTLQALGEDGVLFRFLGKESRKKQEPRIAFLFTLLLVAPCLYFGKIDLIAPLLTMFFLISYGILNLVAGMETLIQSPSWRPSFSVPAIVSLSGALLCLIAMLMINPGATLISTLVVICLYFFRGRKLSSNWDNMCSAIMLYFSRSLMYRLMQSKVSAHSWRPHLQIFSSTLTPPTYLLDFTQKITKGNGFLSFINIIEKKTSCNSATIKKSIVSTLKKRKMKAFVDVRQEESVLKTYKQLITSHGIGPLQHNTVLLTHAEGSNNEVNGDLISLAYHSGKNALVLKSDGEPFAKKVQIDIWWDSDNRKSSELSLVLAHMFQSSYGLKKSHLTLKSIVSSEIAREQRLRYLEDFFAQSRFNVDFKIYVATEEDEIKTIGFFSADADLAFINLPPCTEEAGDYKSVYSQMVRKLKGLKNAIFVCGAEPVDFQEIFK